MLDDPSCRSAVLSLPRGNGKSTLVAGLALWALHDDPSSPSVPVVATTLQQAQRTVFDVARRMSELCPEMNERTIACSVTGAVRLVTPWNAGTLFPLPADATACKPRSTDSSREQGPVAVIDR